MKYKKLFIVKAANVYYSVFMEACGRNAVPLLCTWAGRGRVLFPARLKYKEDFCMESDKKHYLRMGVTIFASLAAVVAFFF